MKKLGKDIRGNVKRDIGGKRYYLGTDEQEAQIRNIKLEQLWDKIKGWANPWQGWPHEIALAIARGETEIKVKPSGQGIFGTVERIADLQGRFPFVRFVPMQDAEMIRAEQQDVAEQLRYQANIREHGIGHGLPFHKALDRFITDKINLDRDTTGQLTESAMRVARNVKILKQHHADVPMTNLDLHAIDELLAYWQNRPIVRKSGKPAAKDTCKEQIKVLRRFLRWAARANVWIQPNGYAVSPIRVRTLPHEHEAKASAEQVQRYKRDELTILWTYARPLERLFMLLALNTGAGQREVITLRQGHIKGNKIKRIRPKNGVYGEWTLWPETQAAIEWYKTHYRAESDAPELCITRTGRPLCTRSEAGNHSREVQNAWGRLLDRIRKDEEHKDFRKLSFNKLRKTSAVLVRKASSGEIAKTHLCHGKPVKDDELSEVYGNKDFRRVFKALRRVHKHLAPVFAAVAEPWPIKPRKTGTSLGKINRVKKLRAQGYTVAKTAEIAKVGEDTVRKYERVAV